MKQFILLLLVIVSMIPVGAQPGNQLTKKGKRQGWELLFDGTSFAGWRCINDTLVNKSWKIDDGNMLATGNNDRENLITLKCYKNFELWVEWKIEKGGNSGILYHAGDKYNGCNQFIAPEYQIIDDTGYSSPLEGWQLTGACYGMYPPPLDKPLKKAGEYNISRIVVKDQHLVYYLNGKKILSFDQWTSDWNQRRIKGKWHDEPNYGLNREGGICLQNYPGCQTWFRNIKIRSL